MAQTKPKARLPGVSYAVSNTGPLISAFQSDSFSLLTKIFAEIHIPTACVAELERHGWAEKMQAASPQLVIVKLTANETKRAMIIAEHISQDPSSRDPIAANHLGEAEAIVLALRSEYQDDLILLDELAARSVAQKMGLEISGFPGVLLLAVHSGLISPEELKERLETCRQKGTHYATIFIQKVYAMAKENGGYS
ncbi:MAG: hypothetical protein ACRENG_23005 [bacterium]